MTTSIKQTERERQAAKAAKTRAAERDLIIPKVKDPKRRAAAEADDCEWLRLYVPSVFRFPFTSDQRQMVEEIGHCLEFGLLKCVAAPRHDGKTSIARYLMAKYGLQKVERNGVLVPRVPLSLILSATGKKSGHSIDAIKHQLCSRPGTPLFDDYPLECTVARYVAPAPVRANNVTADGRALFIEWGANHLILPSYDDEGGTAGMIAAMGITSNDIQGFNLYDVRPRFVLLDDLDDRDSLASEDGGTVAEKIETIIDENISGLGGPGEPFGAVMLCTIPSRHSVAFKYSDPALKQWAGIRLQKIKQWPTHMSLWDEYMGLRKAGTLPDENGKPKDKHGRKAHQFLLDNFAAMHEGAVVSNEHDFVKAKCPDGSQRQVSALQNCFDYICDHGMTSFMTEYQNDPPELTGAIESGITPLLIQKQVNGIKRGVIPPGCTVLTHTCDVGKTKGFHWVVRAWQPDGTGHTIDYGTMSVQGAKYGSDEGLERAIYNSVLRRIDEFKSARYATADGATIDDPISTFDARWQTDAVLAAVAKAGMGVHGIEGIGKSAGCVSKAFHEVVQNTHNRKKCGTTGAYEELHVGAYGKLWVIHANADKWKAFEHDRWLTARDKPGCMFLFGEPSEKPDRLSADERSHEEYAKMICAEIEVEEDNKRTWITKGKENDYLDASWHSCVAAAMKGIRVLSVQPAIRLPPDQRPSARDLAAKARGR